MVRTRISLNTSVPTEEDREMIHRKAKARGKKVSEMVLNYFRRLPERTK